MGGLDKHRTIDIDTELAHWSVTICRYRQLPDFEILVWKKCALIGNQGNWHALHFGSTMVCMLRQRQSYLPSGNFRVSRIIQSIGWETSANVAGHSIETVTGSIPPHGWQVCFRSREEFSNSWVLWCPPNTACKPHIHHYLLFYLRMPRYLLLSNWRPVCG